MGGYVWSASYRGLGKKRVKIFYPAKISAFHAVTGGKYGPGPAENYVIKRGIEG